MSFSTVNLKAARDSLDLMNTNDVPANAGKNIPAQVVGDDGRTYVLSQYTGNAVMQLMRDNLVDGRPDFTRFPQATGGMVMVFADANEVIAIIRIKKG